jgi:hypothetical protein
VQSSDTDDDAVGCSCGDVPSRIFEFVALGAAWLLPGFPKLAPAKFEVFRHFVR